MLTEARYRQIIRFLEEKGIAKVTELADWLGASESTVRRDLIDLEAQNQLKRIHGGAVSLNPKGLELGIEEKSSKNLEQKEKIAQLAARQLRDGDSIYLDAGTTTLAMIPFIVANNITVVTNGLSHIEALVNGQIESYLLGGKMKMRTRAVVGSMALRNIENYRFDKCFLGANGIHPDMGYTTPDPEEALIKRRAHELSGQTFVLADSSKIGEITFTKLFDLQEASLITESVPDRFREAISRKTNMIEEHKR